MLILHSTVELLEGLAMCDWTQNGQRGNWQ